MKRPIGLFDSGVGGLTVLNSVRSLLPKENIIYVGDNIHCPYGNKTKEELFCYASGIVEYFIKRDVKLIVLACNTTSANVLEKLQQAYMQVKIIGVIDATIEDFFSRHIQSTLVIATKATIDSNKYQNSIIKGNKHIKTYALATPKLVPLVESGKYKEGIYDVLHDYLDEYKDKVESIILGCTHYPILLEQIKAVLPNIAYISSSEAIGKVVYEYLLVNKLLNTNTRGNIEIITTGDIAEFRYSSSGFFDYTGLEIKHITIDD